MMHHISLMMLRNAVQTSVKGPLYLYPQIMDLIVGFEYDVPLMILLFVGGLFVELTQQLGLRHYIYNASCKV